LWDSEYGCAPFLKLTADIPADKIMRLRPNRCLWTAPPPTPAKKGRPRKHGDKFQLSDPETWPTPLETLELDDQKWGKIEIKHWTGLHFRESADIPMDIILIQRKGTKLSADGVKPIWLACLLQERVCQVFCVKGKFREETFPQIQWQIGSVRPSSHELALSIS